MIRILTEKDLDQVNKLELELFDFHAKIRNDICERKSRIHKRSEFPDFLADKNKICIGAEIDGKIVGICMASIKEYVKDRKVVYVKSLIVEEEYQKRGLGRKLMERVKEEGKLRGAERIELSVQTFNKEAIEFYSKIGLVPFRTIMEVFI